MDITKDEFNKELIEEYKTVHVAISQSSGCIQLLEEHLSEYYRIVKSITGIKSNGAMRLLIGKMIANYKEGYYFEMTFCGEDPKFRQYLKEEYMDDPEKYIDYYICIEDKEKCNPYKDLVKLERYLSILISQDESIEGRLIKLYENVCEYNKLSLFEKVEELDLFFIRNYKFEWNMDRSFNMIERLFLDYKIYIEHEETIFELTNPIIEAIDRFKNKCRMLSRHHTELYFEILSLFNKIKLSIEKEAIDIDEILKYKKILDDKVSPITWKYFEQAYKVTDEN